MEKQPMLGAKNTGANNMTDNNDMTYVGIADEQGIECFLTVDYIKLSTLELRARHNKQRRACVFVATFTNKNDIENIEKLLDESKFGTALIMLDTKAQIRISEDDKQDWNHIVRHARDPTIIAGPTIVMEPKQ